MMALCLAITLILAGAVPWVAESFTIEEARGNLTTNNTRLEMFDSARDIGSIPPELGSLTSLTSIALSHGLVGHIPSELGNLTNLISLALFENYRLSGLIPPQLGNLADLQYLYISKNNLSGPIPPKLGQLSKLEDLNLASNNLSGLIPPDLGNLANLNALSLFNNSLSGSIPLQLGNLSKLDYLRLDFNGLFGPIPPELGNLSKLHYLGLQNNNLSGSISREIFSNLSNLERLYLCDNNLSGPIPRELCGLPALKDLNLSNNNFSGPIPLELGNLTKLYYLDLSNNNLSGPIPPSVGNLYTCQYLDLSNNNLSSPIPSELNGKMTPTEAYFNGNPLLPMPQLRDDYLTSIGVPGALPSWLLKAKDLVYIRVGPGTTMLRPTILDLAVAPASCRYVKWVGGPISDIIFWDACSGTGGCAVSLIGSSTVSLSRSTRRRVCLNRISVFLDGEEPYLGTYESNGTISFLGNNFGTYFLNGPDAILHGIDTIDLGPSGLSYTGVGVTRVREDNLCGNPGALKIVLGSFGTFLGLLLLVGLGVWVVHHFPTLHEDDSDGSSPGFLRTVRDRFGAYLQRFEDWSVAKKGRLWGAYAWGLIGVGLMALDMYSDTVVLVDVWHAWPMWPILASLCAPYIMAGLFQAANLVRCRLAQGNWLRFVWIWPPYIVDKGEMPSTADGKGTSDIADNEPGYPDIVDKRGIWEFALGRQEDTSKSSRREWLLTILVWPVGIVYVFILDVAAILGKVGFHPEVGGEVYNMEHYHEGRTSLELLLESLPQAIFQSIIFVLGSSMATRIFIDEETFFLSVMSSLANIVFRYCTLIWDLHKDKRGFLEILEVRFKFRSGPCRIVRRQQTSRTDGPEVAPSDKPTAT